jgi:hypothetical protein
LFTLIGEGVGSRLGIEVAGTGVSGTAVQVEVAGTGVFGTAVQVEVAVEGAVGLVILVGLGCISWSDDLGEQAVNEINVRSRITKN